jgi:inhibitor of KinA sporulation pathway (predicted exonuclease)
MPVLTLEQDPPLAAWPDDGLMGILDLEFTAWDGSLSRQWSAAWEWREIVQIGLLLVDAKNGFTAVDETELLIKPNRNPDLSDYFVALTGITQDRVDRDGRPFAESLAALAPLVETADRIVFNGKDGEILRENCEMNQVAFPWDGGRWFNFRPLLARTLGASPSDLMSSDLPALAGIEVPGQAHSALYDCKAIAAAFSVWRRDGRL